MISYRNNFLMQKRISVIKLLLPLKAVIIYELLQGRNSGGVFLTTIHKFTEDTSYSLIEVMLFVSLMKHIAARQT